MIQNHRSRAEASELCHRCDHPSGNHGAEGCNASTKERVAFSGRLFDQRCACEWSYGRNPNVGW